MGDRRARLPLAILVAAVAAGAATLLLRPRGGLIDPATVDPTSYFTSFQLEKAEDYREVQRLIGVAGLVVTGATLTVLAVRPPRALERFKRHPLVGAAAAAAGLSAVLVIVRLPLSAWAHARAEDVGLSTQTWLPWLADVAKSAGLDAVFAAIGATLALALIRRFPRRWWIPGSALVMLFGIVTIWLFPIVVDPLFNRFEPLPPGQVRSGVLELADKAGVDVGEVYRVDASRRTTAANAYVVGLGHSKRVVLYDNLIHGFPRDEVRSVVAHELGHQKHHDLLRGLAWLAIVAPAGTYAAQRLAEAIGRRQGLGDPSRKPGPAALPAIALSVTLVALALGLASNVLSRQVEASADAFSIDLTRDPAAHISLERRLALRNVADPDPPGLYQLIFGTHPTTLERIGYGKAWDDAHD
jgi:STE24 endopeptidase